MREMFERMMLACGWIPAERERILDEQLQQALEEKALVEQNARTLRSNVARAESSWERAEARIRELESDEVLVNRRRAEQLLLNDRLATLGRRAEEMRDR